MRPFLPIPILPLIALTMFAVSSCVDQLPVSHDRNHIMPLAVGNQWIGTVTVRAVGGTGYLNYADTIEIVASDKDGRASSGVVYIDQRDWRHYYVGRELFRTVENINENHWLTSPVPWSRALYPAQLSDTFRTLPQVRLTLLDRNGDDSVLVNPVIATMVMATDTSITVEAGTFRCYRYSLQVLEPEEGLSFATTIESYYSPGIGLVLFEKTSNPDRALQYRWELIDYTITRD